jgi:SAM-dependent methyltransferase
MHKYVAWARTYPNCDAIIHWEKYIWGDVADMGSNAGVFSYLLAELESVKTVTGIDINADAFRVMPAISRAFPNVVRQKVGTPIHANLADLSIVDDDSFDTACCFQTLEHLHEADLEPFLEELKRVVIPSGKIIVCVPYDQFHDSGNHKTYWNEVSLAVLFALYGFKTIECTQARMNMVHGLFENTVAA